MSSSKAAAAFKPVAKVEKADATTRAAREIIARETAERDAKTARLKALRLARDAEAALEAPAPPAPKAASARKTAKPRRAVARAAG